MNVCLLFPGQGSQFDGMAKELIQEYTVVREMFALAEKYTGVKLDRYTEKYDLDKSNEIEMGNALAGQIALYTMSCAIYDVCKERIHNDNIVAIAGHSFGSFAALYSAGIYTFTTGLELIMLRYKCLMKLNLQNTGMLACLFKKDVKYEDSKKTCSKLCEDVVEFFKLELNDNVVCEIANYNSENQIVLSGDNRALEYVAELINADIKADDDKEYCKKYEVLKTVRLKTEMAYHSSLLQEASVELEQYFASIIDDSVNMYVGNTLPISKKIQIIWNNTGSVDNNGLSVSEYLARQLYAPVLWEESIECAIEIMGVNVFYEVGPGKILGNLLKNSHWSKRAEVIAIYSSQKI